MINLTDIRNFIDFIEIIEYFDSNLTETEKQQFIVDIVSVVEKYKDLADVRDDSTMENSV